MSRVCNRPGCDRAAVARLSYDPVGCQVWLDELPERSGPSQEICELHTDRLTVPRGWMLCDRRVAEPALFVAPVGVAPKVAPAVTVIPTRRPRPSIERIPELFEALDAEPDPEPVVELAPLLDADPDPEPDLGRRSETAPPSEPAALEDELPSTLRATSPLLARAFRATGPQHSVLTQGTRPRPVRRAPDDEE